MNKIERKILKRLKHIFSSFAFVQTETDSLYFKKEISHGYDQIGINVKYFIGEYQGSFFYSKRFDLIESPIWKYKSELKITSINESVPVTIAPSKLYINVLLREALNENYCISIEDTPKGIASFCDLLEYNIVEKVLPLAEKFNDIKYLEQRIRNSLKGYTEFSDETLEKDLLQYLNKQNFRYRIPIIAKLAKVDDYSFVCKAMIKEMKRLVDIDKKYQYLLDVMYKLLNDLEYI